MTTVQHQIINYVLQTEHYHKWICQGRLDVTWSDHKFGRHLFGSSQKENFLRNFAKKIFKLKQMILINLVARVTSACNKHLYPKVLPQNSWHKFLFDQRLKRKMKLLNMSDKRSLTTEHIYLLYSPPKAYLLAKVDWINIKVLVKRSAIRIMHFGIIPTLF